MGVAPLLPSMQGKTPPPGWLPGTPQKISVCNYDSRASLVVCHEYSSYAPPIPGQYSCLALYEITMDEVGACIHVP